MVNSIHIYCTSKSVTKFWYFHFEQMSRKIFRNKVRSFGLVVICNKCANNSSKISSDKALVLMSHDLGIKK